MDGLSGDEVIQYYSCYCPDCNSCGEWGCCPFDCEKCRNPDNWDWNRMWDMRKPENKPKKPVGYKYYKHWKDMEAAQ